MHIFAKIARFCNNFKIIHVQVEKQVEDDSNDVKITLGYKYYIEMVKSKNNC